MEDELLNIDKIEKVVRKTFSDSDKQVKNLFENLIRYTREYENDDLKKFVVDLCLFKKMGYLDIVYNNGDSYYLPNTSTIYVGNDYFEQDSPISLLDFIHEATHAFHNVSFSVGVPDEFKQIKENFQKNECLNIILAGYIHNLSRMILPAREKYIDLKPLNKVLVIPKKKFNNDDKILFNTARMLAAFEDVFDALLDGRLHDGVNITSLTYNAFLKLDPKDKDFDKQKEAIIEEYNKIYNRKGINDLNYLVMDFQSDLIKIDGHGSLYFTRDEKFPFMEIIANYMAIKLGTGGTLINEKQMVDNCLKTIFGDVLENYSQSLIDGIYNYSNLQIHYLLNDVVLDGEELLRNEPMVSPLHLAFVSEEKRNDKKFMLEFLKKVLKENEFSEKREFVTRSVGNKLCSDIDFLKQTGNLGYAFMPMANRGNMSKNDYTDLVNFMVDNYHDGFNIINIDRLKNGVKDYENFALKFISQSGNNFKYVDYRNVIRQRGGISLYKELALEASKNHCSLEYFNPYRLNTPYGEKVYSQIVYNRIMDNPYEIEFCTYDFLTDEQRSSFTKLAYDRCLETIEDVQELPKEKLRTIGMMYDKLGVFKIADNNNLNDEQLSIIRDKLTEDVRIHKEKNKTEGTRKTI